MILTMLLTLLWCIRDFLRRASFQLSIYTDRLEVTRLRQRRSLPFAQIETIQLVRGRGRIACVIESRNGKRSALPPDVADRDAINETFTKRLVPVLAEKLRCRLAAGETIIISDLRWRAIPRFAGGIAATIIGCLLFIRLDTFTIAVEQLRRNVAYLRQSKRGYKGGFSMSMSGLSALDVSGQVIRWEDVISATEDEAGLVVIGVSGQKLLASPFARHFWAASSLINMNVHRAVVDSTALSIEGIQ